MRMYLHTEMDIFFLPIILHFKVRLSSINLYISYYSSHYYTKTMWGYSFEEMAKIASEEAAKLAVSNIYFFIFEYASWLFGHCDISRVFTMCCMLVLMIYVRNWDLLEWFVNEGWGFRLCRKTLDKTLLQYITIISQGWCKRCSLLDMYITSLAKHICY